MKKKVLIAMSGGVDSSAAALLLQKQGYECAGATLSLCGNETDGAKRIADGLGMPFYIFDEHELFAREVMDHFVSEYRAGRTPNPCIDCNRCLKFGAFLDRALEMGFDYIATGHYARVGYDEASGRYRLLRGESRAKDQSYVLYQLTQEQLAHLLLPVGSFEKPEIREQAEEAGLANAHQADSQDICFIPDGDYVRFLHDYGGVTPQPGDFVDETGRVLGRHRGLECYTAGQRKGLGVSADRPLYVISKNAENNTVLARRQRGTVFLGAACLACELDRGGDARGKSLLHRQNALQPERVRCRRHTAGRRLRARRAPHAPARRHGRTGRRLL